MIPSQLDFTEIMEAKELSYRNYDVLDKNDQSRDISGFKAH